jgi:methyl-accepting chemotaxis protein
MKNNSTLTMRTRLILGFGVVLAMMLILAVVGIQRVNFIDRSLAEITDINAVKQGHAINFRGSVHDRAIALRDLVLADTPREQRQQLDLIRSLEQDYEDNAGPLDRVMAEADNTSNQERGLLEQIQETEARAMPLVRDLIDARQSGNRIEAEQILKSQAADEFTQWLADINAFIDYQVAKSEALTPRVREQASGFQQLIVGLFVVSLLVAAVVIFLINRYLQRSVGGEPGDVNDFVSAIAEGDLTGSASTRYPDSIMGSVISMRDRLREIVENIRDGVESINSASGEIATGNTDLSQRTEEQASSLEQTAAAMEELTTTVKQNADNAKHADSLAKDASQNADKGGDVVDSVVKRMADIREGSHKMSEIISVIDGIAFQTNILALNAAVEAARAGEQGRGFAVVATEVRSLAQRSASAAKDIKSLIESSVESVNTGSELADRAGTAMDEIMVSIKKVTDIIGEISAASDEQSAGIEQINQAVSEMDQVTQQNAALVEESAAAAESMQSQAEELESSVSRFRISAQEVARNRKKPQLQSQNRGPRPGSGSNQAASKASAGSSANTKPVTSGGDDDWEEF